MRTNIRLWMAVFCFCLAVSTKVGASSLRPLTLAEALETALANNPSYSLFLREQELLQKRIELQRQPQITTELNPVGLENGSWQGPQGAIALTVPLGKSVTLSSKVLFSADENGVGVKPSGRVALDYTLFGRQEDTSTQLDPEDTLQRQVNSLILQVFDLFIELRKALDNQGYAQAVAEHLEAQQAAAQQVPDFDDLKLRRDLREQRATVASLGEQVAQLQLQLQTALGSAGSDLFDPQIQVQALEFELSEEEWAAELFASSPELRLAQRELERSRDQLEQEQKTKGWQVKASGAIQAEAELNWSLGLTASKTLYPRQIVVEELELAVAKAEHNLATVESTLRGELRGSMQAVKAAQNQVTLLEELLSAAEEDLDLRRRQLAAGLVTELQVQEASLAVQKARLDFNHAQLNYARAVAALGNLCGRELLELIFWVVH